jgi:hypothetical protein
VREMGQSAWLSTLSLTLQGSEGRVNAMETENGCNNWISWSNNYSDRLAAECRHTSPGKSRDLVSFRSLL